MATIDQLRSLSMGNQAAAVTQSNGQTIIVQENGVPGSNVCLPCEEGPCEVRPTQAVSFDLGAIRRGGAAKDRMTFQNDTVSARSFVVFSNYDLQGPSNYPKLTTQHGGGGSAGMGDPAFFVNGVATASPLAEKNNILQGGSVISSIIINFDNTDPDNAGLENMEVVLFHYPAKSTDGLDITSVFNPFCDECINTSNGSMTTHKYTINAPITFRDGFYFMVPPGAGGTVELCYGAIALPNTQLDTAANQWE